MLTNDRIAKRLRIIADTYRSAAMLERDFWNSLSGQRVLAQAGSPAVLEIANPAARYVALANMIDDGLDETEDESTALRREFGL